MEIFGIKLMNLIGVAVVFIYFVPLGILICTSFAKDGFIKTFKKIKNFNK
jgi:hypothetical protein